MKKVDIMTEIRLARIRAAERVMEHVIVVTITRDRIQKYSWSGRLTRMSLLNGGITVIEMDQHNLRFLAHEHFYICITSTGQCIYKQQGNIDEERNSPQVGAKISGNEVSACCRLYKGGSGPEVPGND